jgi:hypothetical protein
MRVADFVVVFGFFTLAVAFGVTEIRTVQVPALRARIVVLPLTEHTFFDDDATVAVTRAPLATARP